MISPIFCATNNHSNLYVLGYFVSLSERLCSISIGLVKVTAFLIENSFLQSLHNNTYFQTLLQQCNWTAHTRHAWWHALLSCPLLPQRYFIPWWPTYITRKGTNNSKDFQFPERSPQSHHKRCLKSRDTHQVFIKMVGFVIVVVVLL